MFKMQAKTTSK